MSDERRKALEAFVKQLQGGDSSSRLYIPEDLSLGSQAMKARNLAEDALANEVLKNTGIPIPGSRASMSRKEDFLNQVLSELYPEFEGNPDLAFDKNTPKSQYGYYSPKRGAIRLNPENNKDILTSLSTGIHEAGHKYDDKVLGYNMPDELKKGHKSQLDIKGMYEAAKNSPDELDPTELFERAAKGHHARIPKVRDADSFGLGALKSYLKSGTFKALPIIGTAATAAAALSSPDASAAALDAVVPGGVDSLGPSEEDAAIENPQRNPQLRQEALKRLLGK